ncbi:hypothetical protein FisN_9Hh339 [Fistulifera solaris]|uniref:non-specific serine/threonine protein kinase n=1 Tax=Fistulifera solaris TaxID=1519565 RepID=A0A1Z5KCY1_FISSO|nr:hypothetical protein FisN_9Hh339 [Fistulifera solaris]|eukprot:GAX24087.1 hypothetical protein FisN_9Hh339 [Fistulifera solaris]
MTETIDKFIAAVIQVLQAAEIEPDTDPIQTIERWLGIRDTMTYEGLTVEDCTPLSSAVYEATVQLLNLAWDPLEDASGNHAAIMNFRENALLESSLSPNDITLHQVWHGFLVTKWMIQWMEYNLASAANQDDRHLWVHLLRHDSKDHTLVKAFFVHLKELQILRSHMNAYTQDLRQNHPSSDMSSRLQQYQFVVQLTARLEEEWEEHMQHLEMILMALYRYADAAVRKLIRKLLGRMWHDFVHSGSSSGTSLRQENTQAASIALSLRLLRLILLGVSPESFDQNNLIYRQLITQHLMPLHKTNAVVLWRDQTPVIELYHEALTQCLATMIQKKSDWMELIMPSLLEELALTGNTSKQVLLLHEVETLLKLMTIVEAPPSWWTQLLRVTGGLMPSEHSRVAECSLQLFRNKTFSEMIEAHFDLSLSVILPALVRSEPSWNPTVRKMTCNVLYQLQQSNATRFESLCNKLFSGVATNPTIVPPSSHVASTESIARQLPVAPEVPQKLSLKASMGTWRPPAPSAKASIPKSASIAAQSAHQDNRSQPPSTVTGVAPWAVRSSNKGRSQPPSTITGVAPWAISSSKQHPKRSSEQMNPFLSREETRDDHNNSATLHSKGLDYVKQYMDKIKPPDSSHDGMSDWSRQQLAETPTLLPSLKFHDLVFGHELGSGAFSVVKYARLIDRTKTRSSWAEYAVKIISTEKIREMSYETSVQREIAVLRLLSHPGIARLVSSFRFREGAYMVLEYASRGDLHSVLREHGSMDHDSCRFIIGEVAAALDSIHSIGLVYADLKPENIVITESGHVKLTDYGACRPFTAEARLKVASISKNLLKNLRDGDWQSGHQVAGAAVDDATEMAQESSGTEVNEDVSGDDIRIEGTTAYLPPEVVLGAIPTPAADSWALGCVMYQCLSGRPPLLDSDEHTTRQKIVTFHEGSSSGTVDALFIDSHGAGIQDEARELITRLLERNPARRPSMGEIASFEFFSGCNIFTLHRQSAHALNVGSVGPKPDAQWARRQMSSIWSPQPMAYNIAMPDDNLGFERKTDDYLTPFAEGDEASGSFTPFATSGPIGLAKLTEGGSRS